MTTLTALIERTTRQMAAITGLPADAVSRFDRAACGWTLGIDMLEHRSIPRTRDLIASFEVRLDEDGTLTSWRRTGRFLRRRTHDDR